MYEFFLSSITFLYAGAWLIGLSAFLPTMKDLIVDKKNTANPKTYFMWTITNSIAILYGWIILGDWVFTTLSLVACIFCIIILISSLRLSKQWITYVTPTL